MRVLLTLMSFSVLLTMEGCYGPTAKKEKDAPDRCQFMARYERIFKDQLKQIGISYAPPADFKVVCSDTVFHTTRKGSAMYWVMWNFNYDLASLKHGIQISVKLRNMIGSFDHFKGPAPNKDEFSIVNSNYLKDIYGFTDTILNKPFRYPATMVLEIWNATAAVLCETDMVQFYKEPFYAGKYNRCKMLIVHQDNRGDAIIYYWYNKKSADVIDKVIEQTKAMITFK